MTIARIPTFTPSLLEPEVLERLYVPRGTLLDQVMGRIERAATSRERAHTLVVGPRGSGKTHLMSVLHHRTIQLAERGLQLQVAWPAEDPWGVTSYARLIHVLLDADGPAGTADPDALEAELMARVSSDGPLVCFIENFDEVLDAIGPVGQSRLRFLAQEGHLLLVASTTTVSRDLSDQARPFYAFFASHRLEPLDLDQASDMLSRLARHRGDIALAELVEGGEARSRLGVVSYLAGGQPRIWTILSHALTIEGLEDLAGTLTNRFDDLTPYYQEQMARLSPRQREIVVAMAEADRAMTLKALAGVTGIDQRSLSRTMVDLRERGWVRIVGADYPGVDRRLSFYELTEPLLRLAMQIKSSRGEPIRLVVDFLTHWLDDVPAGTTAMAGRYVAAVLKAREEAHVGTVRFLRNAPLRTPLPQPDSLQTVDRALLALDQGDGELLLGLPTPLRAALDEHLRTDGLIATRVKIHGWAVWAEPMSSDQMREWLDLAATLPAERDDVLGLVIGWHTRAGHTDRALALIDGALDRDLGGPNLAFPLLAVARRLLKNREAREAARLLRLAVDETPVDPSSAERSSAQASIRLELLPMMSDGEAVPMLRDAARLLNSVAFDPDGHELLLHGVLHGEIARSLVRLGEAELALEVVEQAPAEIRETQDFGLREPRWLALLGLGRLEEVIAELHALARSLDETPLRAQLARVVVARRRAMLRSVLARSKDGENLASAALRGWAQIDRESREESERLLALYAVEEVE